MVRSTISTTFNLTSILWAIIVAMGYVKVNALTSMTNGTNIAKPGCSSKCGNVTIPYPFGFGDPSCSLNQHYHVTCDTSYDPPRPLLSGYIPENGLEVLSITETQFRIRNKVANQCYNSSGGVIHEISDFADILAFLRESPFSFSPFLNRLTTIGCSVEGYVTSYFSEDDFGSSKCISNCQENQKVIGGQCGGAGCCQLAITPGLRSVFYSVYSRETGSWPFYNCAYSFLAEEGTFTFGGRSDFTDPEFMNKVMDHVPIVIDWVIGNKTCEEAQKAPDGSYVCQANTECSNYAVSSFGGYICSCLPGYQGNPYLSPGCSDIDECAGVNNCTHACHNLPGDYSCSCPIGYAGDGMKDGARCTKLNSQPQDSQVPKDSQVPILKSALGISVGFFVVAGALWMFIMNKKQKHKELKDNHFRGNGGLLLQELLPSPSPGDEKLKVFTIEEMMAATSNFSEDRVLGKGGHNIVYKGTLPNNLVVAIKKSKAVGEAQIKDFINEMVILGQISHNNVLKIVGCCLETEVPMLVYEYISNGTLFHHIHTKTGGRSWLDWSNCLRIASEVAGALAHLHAAVLPPVIRKVVKSSNILIDEGYTAKISDFGASKLMTSEQNQVPTVVQETLGYLDPEYFHSGRLTEKSNVYSLGIVLIELLTRQKPISEERDVVEGTLSTYFVKSVHSGRLSNILDPWIVQEAPAEQLSSLVKLILNCLSFKGEDRPTMMQVFIELGAMRTHIPHPLEPHMQHYGVNGHSRQAQDG